jgi:hypothetical protein
MRCRGVLRALLICAAVGLSVALLPAAASATVVQSCGNFATIGTDTEQPGYVFSYSFWSSTGEEYGVTVDWGDGTKDTVFVSKNTSQSNPVQVTHTYNNPGRYDLTTETDGNLSDGTPCYDLSPVPLGTIVIEAPSPPPPPAQPVSCGNLRSIGSVPLEAGDGLNYTFATHDFTLDTARIDWGDGNFDTLAHPLGPNSTLDSPTHFYNSPGVYDVYVTVAGHFTDGTPCQDHVYVGTVTVSSAPASSPPPVTGSGPCTSCQALQPPSITTATHVCNKFLRGLDGHLGRIVRRGTGRRTTCSTAKGSSRTCTTTVTYKPCGCRYIITTLVPLEGTPHVVKVRKKRLHRGRNGGRRTKARVASGGAHLVRG